MTASPRVTASGYVKNSNRRLSDEDIDKASSTELLAIAKSRGYRRKDNSPFDILVGRSMTKSDFKEAQAADKELLDDDDINEKQTEEDLERTAVDHTPEGAPAQIRLPAEEPIGTTMREDFKAPVKTGHATKEEDDKGPTEDNNPIT